MQPAPLPSRARETARAVGSRASAPAAPQLAFLARTGLVELVLAEDSDMLAFGCPAVLFKMDAAGNGRLLRRERLPELADPSARGDGAAASRLFAPWEGWDARLFLEMCILAGCARALSRTRN